ncbi:MAG: ATP-binding protein [Anaerolineae bacterium]|nr:ATP-binding protein [Anaerolineae bacterium]MDW8099033.1 ATP-binding protein [Anaerolineae bacterium]
MRRLWVWLTASFVAVTLIGVTLVAVLAARQADLAFRQYALQAEMGIGEALAAKLAEYYTRAGGWRGIEQLSTLTEPDEGLMSPGMRRMRRGMHVREPGIIVANANGRIVFDSARQRLGGRLTPVEQRFATPIEVDGQTVGYVFAAMPSRMVVLSPPAMSFLESLRRAIWQAGLIAGALSIALGLILSRALAAPLAHLTAAVRGVAAGDLSQRVPEQGPEEVAELGRAFNQMTEALARAEELRRNLVADVAHELRTPLTVIQGNLRAILDGVYPLEASEIATIYDETRLLSRLVDDLRELAQAEAGQLPLERRPVDMGELIQTAITGFGPVASEHQVTLTAEVAPDLPMVHVDPDRISQVLRNLLSNALRHTPSGGQVTVMAQAGPEGFITLRVQDTGSGIALEDLPHVFERFWRADRSRARRTGGTGLGLAIARHLVEIHGGKIGVESRPGQGATFWFTLPVARGLELEERGHEKETGMEPRIHVRALRIFRRYSANRGEG